MGLSCRLRLSWDFYPGILEKVSNAREEITRVGKYTCFIKHVLEDDVM